MAIQDRDDRDAGRRAAGLRQHRRFALHRAHRRHARLAAHRRCADAAHGCASSALVRRCDRAAGVTGMTDWPYPFWIAHRGAGKLAPENTLAAFRVGASHGYRAFECDVKLSADGVPFLLHDATLQRTTPERGTASRLTWSELARLDAGGWHGGAYAGEPPPSLDAIAAYCIRNDYALNIEI